MRARPGAPPRLILAVDALLRSRAEIDAKERGEVAHDGVLWLGGHQRRVEGLRRVQGHEDVGDTLLQGGGEEGVAP
eukprot:scaffold23638_cov79-Isochrysis_galbana.AAC.2